MNPSKEQGGNSATIITSNGKVVIVDSTDYEKVAKFKWCAITHGNKKWRVFRTYRVNGVKKGMYLCREILGVSDKSKMVFHINQNPLDNRRANLEVCTKNKANLKHGLKHTSEYRTWQCMKDRCLNKNDHAYKHYGARGIKICKRWMKLENFISDMGKKPSKEHSIDRINNNGNYSPKNCRWADRTTQGNNRRGNRFITLDGVRKTISQWTAYTGLRQGAISYRLKQGWTVRKALSFTNSRNKES